MTVEEGAVLRDVIILEPPTTDTPEIATVSVTAGGTVDGIIDRGSLGLSVIQAGTVENSNVGVIQFTDAGGLAINDTTGGIVVLGYQQNGQNVSASATVVNTIATSPKGLQAFSINFDGPNAPTATATMNLSYYVGDTWTMPPNSGGGQGSLAGHINASNQIGSSATPLGLASDGVHETAASPTINAGTAAATGLPADDFDGGVRSFGAAPDVGADEAGTGLAIMNTLAASNITTSGATLHGTIDTNEVDNPTVRFLYGKGSALTSQTAAHDVPPGISNVAQQVALTGLSPNTTYSFVIESGSLPAQVLTFHTANVNPFKGVVFEQHTATASKQRVVALQLFCPTNTLGFCQGTFALTSGKTTLGSHTFLTNHGDLFTVKVTLTQSAFNQLVQKRTLTVLATAAAHDANGNKKTTSASITLKAPPR
jgi:hypothetical protein